MARRNATRGGGSWQASDPRAMGDPQVGPAESLTMHVVQDASLQGRSDGIRPGFNRRRFEPLELDRRRSRTVLLVAAMLALVLAGMQADRAPTVAVLAPTNGRLALAPTDPVALRWTVSLPQESHAVAVGPVVVTTPATERTAEGTTATGLTARYAQSGDDAWSVTLPPAATAIIVDPTSGTSRRIGGLSRFPTGRGPEATSATPATVVVGLRANDGGELWRVTTDDAEVRVHAATASILGSQRCVLVASGSGLVLADVPEPCAVDTTGSALVHGGSPGDWTTTSRNGPTLPASTSPPLLDGDLAVTTTDDGVVVTGLDGDGASTTFELPRTNESCSSVRPVAAVGVVADCLVRRGLEVVTGTVLGRDGEVLAIADSTAQLVVVEVDGLPRGLSWERRPLLDVVRLTDLAGARAGRVVAERAETSFEVLRNGGSSPATADGILSVLTDEGRRQLALLSWDDLSPVWTVPLPPGGVVDSLAATGDVVVAITRGGDGSSNLLGFW